ncbi:peptidylprolyl isomerase [Simplicispira psychrophila]|uniref:peptidylprolyl isomerase n=1 Tax=Simplicispira psychrophila TaxID=80882 RepID=UPI000481B49F|nr:peptidylprolyl isomerase [Simplicispira psychrophila]
MKYRALAVALACLASLASQGAAAQGLRPSGAGKTATARGLAPSSAAPAALPAGAAPSGIRQADYIVAVVNSEPVTNHEVSVRLARIQAQLARQGGAVPLHEVLVRDMLERTILEKAQLQAAREIGIKVDALAVTQAEESVARQNGITLAAMQQRLAVDGISPERFREELRNQLMLQRLREREVDARVRVSELDIDQYLHDQQPAATGANTGIELAQVLMPVPETASPAEVAALQARAQIVADKARAGDDFAALARDYSAAPESAQGGSMGMRSADRYPELFMQATQALPVGAIVGPLRSGAGFHVLKVLAKSQGGASAMAMQTHARHILLVPGPQLSETAAAQRLADYRQRILAGQADFAELAREVSKDGSAKQGGDLGWATPGRYVPEFEAALQALQPGEISAPLVSRFGVHLIQLLERRQVQLSQREQRDMVRDTVREKKMEAAYATWVQELRSRAYVEYRDAPQ